MWLLSQLCMEAWRQSRHIIYSTFTDEEADEVFMLVVCMVVCSLYRICIWIQECVKERVCVQWIGEANVPKL